MSLTSVMATAISASRIQLSWVGAGDNIGVTGYKIYRNGIHLDSTSLEGYEDSGLKMDTDYTYTILAVDDAGNESGPSPVASAHPFDIGSACVEVPALPPPTGNVVNVSTGGWS